MTRHQPEFLRSNKHHNSKVEFFNQIMQSRYAVSHNPRMLSAFKRHIIMYDSGSTEVDHYLSGSSSI